MLTSALGQFLGRGTPMRPAGDRFAPRLRLHPPGPALDLCHGGVFLSLDSFGPSTGTEKPRPCERGLTDSLDWTTLGLSRPYGSPGDAPHRRGFCSYGHNSRAELTPDQILVFQRLSLQEPSQRIPEQVDVVTVVVAPHDLLQIGVKVLDAEVVVGTYDGALQEAPYALNRVCVHVAADPLVDVVIDHFVPRVLVFKANVGLMRVRVDGLGFVGHCLFDEAVQDLAAVVRPDAKADVAAAFDGCCRRVRRRLPPSSYC